MKLRHTFYLAIATIATAITVPSQLTATASAKLTKASQTTGKQSAFRKYVNSIAAGIVIGGATGLASACADKPTDAALWWITFPIAGVLRSKVEDSVVKTFEEDNIRHCPDTLRVTSWVASWLSWMAFMQYKPKAPGARARATITIHTTQPNIPPLHSTAG
jgi:hypothetical protein